MKYVDHLAHAAMATCWIARRYIRRIDGPRVDLAFGLGRGVLISKRFVVTTAHGTARPGEAKPVEWIGDDDMWIPRRTKPLELGASDTCITVSREKPEQWPVKPSYARLFVERALAIRGPDELLAPPLFIEPITDLALLGVNAPDRSYAVAIRRTPIVAPEPVDMLAGDEWVRAVAIPKPGPLVMISNLERPGALAEGCCGGPVIDQNGELVTVVNTLADGSVGLAGQLCLSLPPWALARIAA